MVRSVFFSALLCVAAWTSEGAAQRAQGEGTLSISARLDGKTYQAAGRGNCRHAPTASIYDVPAALWTVEYAGSRDASIRQLNLTLWRPKNGTEAQFSISWTQAPPLIEYTVADEEIAWEWKVHCTCRSGWPLCHQGEGCGRHRARDHDRLSGVRRNRSRGGLR